MTFGFRRCTIQNTLIWRPHLTNLDASAAFTVNNFSRRNVRFAVLHFGFGSGNLLDRTVKKYFTCELDEVLYPLTKRPIQTGLLK